MCDKVIEENGKKIEGVVLGYLEEAGNERNVL